MKLSSLVLLGAAAALPFGIYLSHRVGTLPSTAEYSTEASIVRTSSDEKTGASTTVAGSNRITADGIYKDIAALRRELALLRAEISALQRQQSRMAATAAIGPEEDPANDPRKDPTALAEADRRYQEQMEALETHFKQEPTDPHWSSEAAAAVQEAMAGDEAARTALRNIECRANTCRVEMAEDDTGKLAKSMPLLLQQLAQTLPSVTANQVDDGDGAKTMILYMSREPE